MIRKDFHCTLIAALLALGATAAQAASPAPTSIDTLVSVAYQSVPGGDTQIVISNDASVTVSAPAAGAPAPSAATVPATVGASLTPPLNSQIISRNARTVFPVTLRNTGIGTDTFTLTLAPARGWRAVLICDSYGDGVLRPGENTLAPGQVTLAAGSSRSFFVIVTPPALVRSDTSGTVVLSAVSSRDATKAAQSAVTTDILG